ncbi:MAG: T9SS type A sorting domain-containing protein [Ignavibacteria bacterium]|nr:T9SS type A sorting domain-containing protein [Ignavibacteria bacterium]
MKKLRLFIILAAAVFLIYGWGATGHKIINRKSVYSFSAGMLPFSWWRDSLAAHSSDADYRKNADPTESYRHYIDIDIYPEFLANGRIPQNLDSLIALHGATFVTTNGIVPFAIISYTDSVKIYLQQHNWQYAMLKAADLGHYVGDAHNPLHNTRYYDGWSTFSNGIHSRFETGLINRDSAYLQYPYDAAAFVNNINNFAFNITYTSYGYVDSVYRADSIAHIVSGSTGSTLYYQIFWEQAAGFTNILFKNASLKLASLIYTAWVNAGSPIPTYINNGNANITTFELKQNFPNPFNPSTTINFNLKKDSFVKLAVYDALGREAEVLISKEMNSGEYSVKWNAEKFASGIYYYRLQAGDYSDTRRMILKK